MAYRKYKYVPVSFGRGEFQANGELENSDIIGAIKDCIGKNIAKLEPQVIRKDTNGQQIRNDYLARMLRLRWSPELSVYDALYKMAAKLVEESNSFAAIFYSADYSRIERIVPIDVNGFKIFEEEGVVFVRFTWRFDGKSYTMPYGQMIHLRARFDKKRFIGSEPGQEIKNTLELIDASGQAIRNIVKNSANLKGYLKYNNFADDDLIKEKVREFQEAYMSAENDGGIAGLDSTMEFKEITQRAPTIPTLQINFLRENIYRYYGVNENILMSKFSESEWNAFYESVIEPIALQLSLEFTFKLLSDRERGWGNKIIFSSNRLQYATLQTRSTIGKDMLDRGAITINEYRELLYYEPLEDGDVRLVSLNYVKAEDQTKYQTGEEEKVSESDTQGRDKKIYVKAKLKGKDWKWDD